MANRTDPRRVLVLDADQAAALAVVRALGRRGLAVDAAERRPDFLAAYSRWTRDACTYPDPLTDAGGFVEAIAARLRRVRYDLVIPVAEDTLHPLALARARLEPLAPLAIAPTAALETMLDKARTFALARALGVPVPESHTFADAAALARYAEGATYPRVLKPSRSIAGGAPASPPAGRTRVAVAYAHDPRELVRLGAAALRHGPVIVQEYFRGTGVGVELLADHGEVVYAFQHRRLHELPLTGGGSCLRESVPVDPMLLAHARRLLAAVGWHGVAMVEFKLDAPARACRLMEVNGRFWGSLPLAVAAGADFPYMLVELLTRGRRPEPRAYPARTGLVCRKLSADVYWHVQVLRPAQDEPLIEWPTRATVLADALGALSPRHRFDVQSLDDPRPGWVDARRTGAWVLARARAAWAHRRRLRDAAAAGRSARLTGALARARTILFVCHGNINRSVLAEHQLRALLPSGEGLALSSAGFHPEGARPADPRMVEVARRHGLDLGGHASRVLNAELVSCADLVFAMELRHLALLVETYPQAGAKSFLLGAMAPAEAGVPLELGDPQGGDPATFERCYRHLSACTAAVARRRSAAAAGGRATPPRHAARPASEAAQNAWSISSRKPLSKRPPGPKPRPK